MKNVIVRSMVFFVGSALGTSEQPTTFPRFQKTAGPLRANSLVLGR